ASSIEPPPPTPDESAEDDDILNALNEIVEKEPDPAKPSEFEQEPASEDEVPQTPIHEEEPPLSADETLKRDSEFWNLTDHIAETLKKPPAEENIEAEVESAPMDETTGQSPETVESQPEPEVPAAVEPVPEEIEISQSSPSEPEKDEMAVSSDTEGEKSMEEMVEGMADSEKEDKKEKTGFAKSISSFVKGITAKFGKKDKKIENEEEPDDKMPVAEMTQTISDEGETEPSREEASEEAPSEKEEEEALIEDAAPAAKENSEKKKSKIDIKEIAEKVYTVILSLVVFCLLAFGAYRIYVSYMSSSQLDLKFRKTSAAIQKQGEATESAKEYIALLGTDPALLKAASLIGADWGKQLREQSKKPGKAVELLTMLRGTGLKSPTLDEELIASLMALCANEIKTGDLAAADSSYMKATDMLALGSLPAPKAESYSEKLAHIGYLLISVSRGSATPPEGAISKLPEFRKHLDEKESAEIAVIARETAEKFAAEGRAALSKGDRKAAGVLARRALLLNPSSRNARALLIYAGASGK
ncbi:MAG TPA: hypothetical protein PLQ76_03060, partial [bacterium]|nr:hypothetical protein [bacterium]